MEAFSFIGLPKDGADSLANALATLLQYSFRISLLPDSIEKGSNGSIDLRQAKESFMRGLQRAGVRAMQEFAADIIIMSKTPLHEASKPKVFAPTDGGLRVELLTISESLKPIDAEIKLDVALRRNLGPALVTPTTPQPAASVTNLSELSADSSPKQLTHTSPPASVNSAWGPPSSCLLYTSPSPRD